MSPPSVVLPMRCNMRVYLKSSTDEGIIASSGGGSTTTGFGAGAGGVVTFKYLTLESIVSSSHARFSMSRRRLRPVVPPIDLHSLRADTVVATQS